jgi:alcohol dehydrogenase (cytochrome c)
MKFSKIAFVVVASALLWSAFPGSVKAQNVDAAMLLHPPTDSWPSYHGDYTGKRHS